MTFSAPTGSVELHRYSLGHLGTGHELKGCLTSSCFMSQRLGDIGATALRGSDYPPKGADRSAWLSKWCRPGLRACWRTFRVVGRMPGQVGNLLV